MSTPYRPASGLCATCGTGLDPSQAFLSSEGALCEACHRAQRSAERGRSLATTATREGTIAAFVAALAALFCVLMAVCAWSLDWVPVRIVPFSALATGAAMYHCVASYLRSLRAGRPGILFYGTLAAAIVAALGLLALLAFGASSTVVVPVRN
jgi:hypothetical protein